MSSWGRRSGGNKRLCAKVGDGSTLSGQKAWDTLQTLKGQLYSMDSGTLAYKRTEAAIGALEPRVRNFTRADTPYPEKRRGRYIPSPDR